MFNVNDSDGAPLANVGVCDGDSLRSEESASGDSMGILRATSENVSAAAGHVLWGRLGERHLFTDPVVASIDAFFADASKLPPNDRSLPKELIRLSMSNNQILDQIIRTFLNNPSVYFPNRSDLADSLQKCLSEHVNSPLVDLVYAIEDLNEPVILDRVLLELHETIRKFSLVEEHTVIVGHQDRRLFVLLYIILNGLVSACRSSYVDKGNLFHFDTKYLYPGNGHEKYNKAIGTSAYNPFHVSTEQAYTAFCSKLFDVGSIIERNSILYDINKVDFRFLGPGKNEINLVLAYLRILNNPDLYLAIDDITISCVSNSVLELSRIFTKEFIDGLGFDYSVYNADMFNVTSGDLPENEIRISVMKGGTSCNPSEEEILNFLDNNTGRGSYVYFDFQPTGEYSTEELIEMYSSTDAIDFVTHNPLVMLSMLGATEKEKKLFRISVDVDVVSHHKPYEYAKTVRHSVDLSEVSPELIQSIEKYTGVDLSSNQRWVISESTRRDSEAFEQLLVDRGFEVNVFTSSEGHVPQVIGMLVTKS